MKILEYCHINVVTAELDTAIVDVAKLMRGQHVGDVVVIEKREGKIMPVGVVTDRDLVVELLAEGMDPENVTAGDLMTRPVVSVSGTESVKNAVAVMSKYGVRRVVVTGDDDQLVGIFSMDDAVSMYSAGIGELAHLIDKQFTHERYLRTSHREVASV